MGIQELGHPSLVDTWIYSSTNSLLKLRWFVGFHWSETSRLQLQGLLTVKNGTHVQTSMISFWYLTWKKTRKKTDAIEIPEMPLLCFISAFFLTLTTSGLDLFFSVSFWRLFVESGWRFHPSQLPGRHKNGISLGGGKGVGLGWSQKIQKPHIWGITPHLSTNGYNWWFGLVSGIPRIPENERDCYLGYPDLNPKPPVPKHPIKHQLNLGNPEKKTSLHSLPNLMLLWKWWEFLHHNLFGLTLSGILQTTSQRNTQKPTGWWNRCSKSSRFHQETKNCQQKHLNISCNSILATEPASQHKLLRRQSFQF